MTITSAEQFTPTLPEGWEVKGVKIAEFASEETLCFEASIYRNGKKVGTTRNDGRGGADFDQFDNKADDEAYREAAKVFDKQFRSTDILTSALIREWELQKIVRANKRKGFPITLQAWTGRYEVSWDDNPRFKEEFTMNLRDLNDAKLAGIIAEHGIERYRIVEA